MSRQLPPLNALRAFEAAGRHGNFSRAADELGVSHSAVSRHVRGLEHHLGAALFCDAGQGVALTPEGRNYLARISPAFEAIGEATESVSEAAQGRVIVNSDPVYALQVVAPRLAEFREAHPEIELELVGSTSLADVDRYEADLAIRFLRAGRLERATDLLSAAPMLVYAKPGLLPERPSVAEILSAPRLQDRPPEFWQTWADAAGWDGPPLDMPSWRMRAPISVEATLGGYGVYLSSAECMNRHCLAGRLVRLSDVSIQTGAYHLLTQQGATRRKPVRAVRSWLLEISDRFRTPEFWKNDQPVG